MTEAQKKILFPSSEDQAGFADFLSRVNSGLFRLLPKGKYEFRHTIDAGRDPDAILPVLGGGAYYSFVERTHKFGPWSDIRLEDNRLFAGPTPKAIGIIASLGNVRLESVTVDTPGLSYLVNLVAPRTYPALADLHRKVSQGVEASGFAYGSAIEAMQNTTYVLRSISYKKDGYVVYPSQPYTRLDISRIGYDGTDILVALRILRRNQDGSFEILWKRLQRFQSPKLKGQPASHTFKSVEQLIEREIPRGSKVERVMAFLDSHGIEHWDYVEAYEQGNATPGTTGIVSANIPGIERRVRAIFDLYIQFYFNERRDLIGYGLKKVRK